MNRVHVDYGSSIHGGGRPSAATTPDVRLPAWLASAVVHGALLIIIALSWRHFVPRSIRQGEPERQAGIAVVETRGEEQRYLVSPSAPTETGENSSSTVTADVALESSDPSLAPLPELGTSRGQFTGGVSVPGAQSFTAAGQPTRGLAGQGRTSVFGAEAVGSKFVYVFDRSGSMNGFGGRPLAAAKDQLLASLSQLEAKHQFQIIFYNERADVFNPLYPQPPQLLFADEQGKRLAQRFVQGMTATGGSQHYEALRLALQMQPDVIFFLTDGQENTPTPRQLETLLRQASRAGTTIHTIELGVGPLVSRTHFLVYLSSQTGGKYVYVDVTKFAR